MNAGPVINRLRCATGDIHKGLDERLNAIDRLSSRETRGAMVNGYLNFHSRADAAFAPWLAGERTLDYGARRRTPALEQALATLRIAPVRSPGPPLAIANLAQAYGAFYVVEGSTLGGRMIRKAVAALGRDLVGLDFLDPYGDDSADRWRTFMALLEDRAKNREAQAVIGATAAFALAEECLHVQELAA